MNFLTVLETAFNDLECIVVISDSDLYDEYSTFIGKGATVAEHMRSLFGWAHFSVDSITLCATNNAPVFIVDCSHLEDDDESEK